MKVGRRIDREQLCPQNALASTSERQRGLNAGQFASLLLDQNNGPMQPTPTCQVSIQIKLYSSDSQLITEPTMDEALSKQMNMLLHLAILIEDINDNAPYWPGHLQRLQINFRDGDPVGERRTLPPAYDLDAGVNGQLSYELLSSTVDVSGENTFNLDQHPSDGIYLYNTKAVDREEKSSYQLLLRAIDQAGSSMEPSRRFTSTLTIDIHVEDLNDNSPTFSQPIFPLDNPVPETIPVGTVVMVLNASDADAGNNGAFHFGFSKDHAWLAAESLARQYFDVRPTGQIVVRRPLNVDLREFGSGSRRTTHLQMLGHQDSRERGMSNHRGAMLQFRFRVTVEDEAVRPYSRSSEATVVILVRDENDEAPMIEVTPTQPNQHLSLPPGWSSNDHFPFPFLVVQENRPVGTVIAKIQVGSNIDILFVFVNCVRNKAIIFSLTKSC